MTEQITPKKEMTIQEHFAGFPEAPASDTFKWVDGVGIEHMTTIRAWSGGTVYSEVSKFIQNVIETGGRSAALQPAPKPAQAPAPTESPATANAAGTSFKVSKIKVTPEIKDGAQRIMVEIFQEGHQWADIKAFFTTGEQAHTAFSSVTDLNFNEPGEYQINCIADYRLSDKKNSKGNPYKNLVSVRPA
jgi:hypothetical protein